MAVRHSPYHVDTGNVFSFLFGGWTVKPVVRANFHAPSSWIDGRMASVSSGGCPAHSRFPCASGESGCLWGLMSGYIKCYCHSHGVWERPEFSQTSLGPVSSRGHSPWSSTHTNTLVRVLYLGVRSLVILSHGCVEMHTRCIMFWNMKALLKVASWEPSSPWETCYFSFFTPELYNCQCLISAV
jgi:hypothetical protein